MPLCRDSPQNQNLPTPHSHPEVQFLARQKRKALMTGSLLPLHGFEQCNRFWYGAAMPVSEYGSKG